MADPQHVEWLREGVKSWNKRRIDTPFIPDLTGADLLGADLQEADLLGADLRRANLQGADLREANVKSVLSTNDENKTDFTVLSHVLGLTQSQLDTMRGDSATEIPGNLKYPKHWPEWLPTDDEALKNATPLAETVGVNDDGFATVKPIDIANEDLYQTALNKANDALNDAFGGNSIGVDSTLARILARTLKKYPTDPQRVHDDFVLSRDLIDDGIKQGYISDDDLTKQLRAAMNIGSIDIREAHPEVAAAVRLRGNTNIREMTSKERADLQQELAILPKISDATLAPQFKEDIQEISSEAIEGSSNHPEPSTATNALYRIASRVARIYEIAKKASTEAGNGVIFSAKVLTALGIIKASLSFLFGL